MITDFPSHFFYTTEASRFLIRPVHPSDKDLLQKGFAELSERSKYLRLFEINNRLSDVQLNYFTEVDGIQHVAWGILDASGSVSIPVAIGRFVKFKEEQDMAEVAITVIDSHQGKGLGRLLFATLNLVAGKMDLKKLRHYVLSENRFALNALKKFNIISQKNEGTLTTIDIKVIPNHMAIPADPKTQTFISVMKTIEKEFGISINRIQKG
ncbi:GNAT family N-acetyltransferase [Patiriisocius sp. Uisw_047]|uniref:GNAT family N-acetyltransferase n=1 Tax=Patiriisocius sp. Uisw_047 TaxID=3230969 RepID=UPI0039E8D1B7